ncbi:MAG: helix-turn-helix domain-containing protein [Flavobacteriaceae bacterium]
MGTKKQPTNRPPGGKRRATPQQQMLFSSSRINPDNLYTTAEVKMLFGISESSVKRWRKDKVLPYVKLRGTIFYLKDAILKILEERIVYPDS